MNDRGFINTAYKQYWKVALWVTAAITLVTLLSFNLLYLTEFVDVLVISVGFSLLFSAVFSVILRNVASGGRESSVKSFMIYAIIRLLVAVALMGAYVMFKGGTAHDMIPALVVFTAYFILLDVLDAIFMVKIQRAMEE